LYCVDAAAEHTEKQSHVIIALVITAQLVLCGTAAVLMIEMMMLTTFNKKMK
jgi:hypothetical protein